MKAVGLVVEYNPFHYGHAHHLNEAKTNLNADVVIAVMSGNFLQRGEPALVNKWYRTKMALKAGADLVIELPYQFAVQKADTFAFGAVSILNELRCDYLCFGSESGQIASFEQAVTTFIEKEAEINSEINKIIKTGITYPQAVSEAFKIVTKSDNRNLIDLSQPNNILGFQYVKVIKQLKSNMKPATIKRQGANYHDKVFTDKKIASATSIRKSLLTSDNNLSLVKNYLPDTTFDLLVKYKDNYKTFHNWEQYWPLLQYKLISTNSDDLNKIYEMEEGLENRFKKFAFESNSFAQLIENVKTKRYSWTRLQRAATHLLTDTSKDEMICRHDKISYLRLLGFTDNGRQYLNKVKHNLKVPLLTKLASFKGTDPALDIKASHVHALGVNKSKRIEMLKAEYEQQPLYIRD